MFSRNFTQFKRFFDMKIQNFVLCFYYIYQKCTFMKKSGTEQLTGINMYGYNVFGRSTGTNLLRCTSKDKFYMSCQVSFSRSTRTNLYQYAKIRYTCSTGMALPVVPYRKNRLSRFGCYPCSIQINLFKKISSIFMSTEPKILAL